MIQIIRVLSWLQLVALTTICAPIKNQMGNVQIVYHVGDIAEHAYNADTWNNNNNNNPPNLLPRIPALPQVPLNSATGFVQNSSSSISSSSSVSSSSSSSQSQQTNNVNREHRISSTEAPIGSNIASGITTTTNNPLNKGITSQPSLDATARSLETFLAMLEETRTKDAQAGIDQRASPTPQQQPAGLSQQTPTIQLQQQQQPVDVQHHSSLSPQTPAIQLQQSNLQFQQPIPQLPQPSPQLPQPSPQLPQPSPQLPQPSPQLPQPSPQLPQPIPQLPQSIPQLPLPIPQLPQPSPQLQQPSPQLQQPSPQLQQPSPQLQQPSPQLQQPSPQLQQPSPQLQHPSPQLQHPSPQLQQPNQQASVIQLQQPTSSQLHGQPPNPLQPQEWAVYDDLDTQESNQTAVIASNQKFGYVVHGSNYKRFRVEEKAANGLITGQFGVQHNNGRFRGVQYVADPANVNPKVLYDALVKFLSL